MKKNNQSGGFVKLFMLIIIVLVISQYLGYGPVDIWNKIVWPVAVIAWNGIVLLYNLGLSYIKPFLK